MKNLLPRQLFANGFSTLLRNIIRHPKYRGWLILGGLLYLLSPLDISPDVFPVVGWIDDGLIVTLLVTEVSQMLLDRRKEQRVMKNLSQREA